MGARLLVVFLIDEIINNYETHVDRMTINYETNKQVK